MLAPCGQHIFILRNSATGEWNHGRSQHIYITEVRPRAATRDRGRHVRHNLLALTLVLLASCLAAWSARTAAAPQIGKPAVWRPHDLIVDLHNLPRNYSCDDLWYKFRDILLAFGARPDTKILVYQCADRPGAPSRSPSVHLQFSTPELVSGAQARWAEIDAASETIRLSPGQPASLRDSDCELMRQIKDGLLPELAERIVSFDLACAAPRPSHWPFNVTVQTLTPVHTNPRVTASVGALPKRIR